MRSIRTVEVLTISSNTSSAVQQEYCRKGSFFPPLYNKRRGITPLYKYAIRYDPIIFFGKLISIFLSSASSSVCNAVNWASSSATALILASYLSQSACETQFQLVPDLNSSHGFLKSSATRLAFLTSTSALATCFCNNSCC